MTDILIRDVPDEVLAAIDAKATRMGLSWTAYLRRALERECAAHRLVARLQQRPERRDRPDMTDIDVATTDNWCRFR